MSNSELVQQLVRNNIGRQRDQSATFRESFTVTGTPILYSGSATTPPPSKSSSIRSGYYTSTEDEEENKRNFHRVESLARNLSHRSISFPIGGPVQAPECDWSLIADAEAARKHEAMDCNIESGADINVAMELTGSTYGRHSSVLPIYLKFEDVKYKTLFKPKTSWSFGKSAIMVPKEKEILRRISGSVAPGELLALMGPSGCGKTTLLNVLGGRVFKNVTGSITYNGLPYIKSLKRRIGFVTQDDILFPHLTVRETLMYAALLRLPKSLTKQLKIQRAEDTIVELGLERYYNRGSLVEGHFRRGHLDEPTSGLESTIALRIIQLIQSIAQGGRTVVASIHQPSSRLFNMFSKVALLSEGQIVYYGKAAEAMDYFSSIGFSPAMAMNPADFLLDLANGTLDAISTPPALEVRQSTESQKNGIADQGKPSKKAVHQYLVENFNSQAALLEDKKHLEFVSVNEELKEAILEKREWSTSWWQQFYVLLIRGFTERRHEYLSWLRISQITVMSVLVGMLWWQSKIHNESELLDQVGLIFFMNVFWCTLPMSTAIFTFSQQRAMLEKERASDMYQLSAYFLSCTLGDVPMDMLLSFVFVTIVYFMTHLQMSARAFFLTAFTISLDAVTSQGLGLFIGGVVMDVKKATTMASITSFLFLLTGGFYVQHMPIFISWLKYLSINFYCFRLLLKVQYNEDQRYNCSSREGCSIATSPAIHNVQLNGGGIEALALLLMAFGYRALGYFALRRMKLGV